MTRAEYYAARSKARKAWRQVAIVRADFFANRCDREDVVGHAKRLTSLVPGGLHYPSLPHVELLIWRNRRIRAQAAIAHRKYRSRIGACLDEMAEKFAQIAPFCAAPRSATA